MHYTVCAVILLLDFNIHAGYAAALQRKSTAHNNKTHNCSLTGSQPARGGEGMQRSIRQMQNVSKNSRNHKQKGALSQKHEHVVSALNA